jgi:hypothetical protein
MSLMSLNLTGLDLICGMKNHTNSTHVIHGVQVSEIVFYVLVLIISKRAILLWFFLTALSMSDMSIMHSPTVSWIICNESAILMYGVCYNTQLSIVVNILHLLKLRLLGCTSYIYVHYSAVWLHFVNSSRHLSARIP